MACFSLNQLVTESALIIVQAVPCFMERSRLMQKIDIMSSHALDPVQNDWSFAEVWVDPMLSPPYILLLLCDLSGICRVYDPAQGYKVVFTSASYDEAQNWLLEDEYEPMEGRLAASEL
jgi:hypothetical protein